MTPSTPPVAQTSIVSQYGILLHHPTITKPGSTNTIVATAPAALPMVWTMLFSTIVDPPSVRSTAIEITAAGIAVEKVSPTRSPK